MNVEYVICLHNSVIHMRSRWFMYYRNNITAANKRLIGPFRATAYEAFYSNNYQRSLLKRQGLSH